MKKLFITALSIVLTLNIGFFIYSEVRAKRFIAEMNKRAINTENRVRTVSTIPIDKLPSGPEYSHTTVTSFELEPDTSLSHDESHELSESSQEMFDIVDELLNDADAACCPEDEELEHLSWAQRVRKKLTEKHGDIPEIDTYIELTSVYRDGGNLTVSEVVRHLELQVMLYGFGHGDLDRARYIAEGLSPNAIVKVNRTYHGTPPSEGTTTSSEVVNR